MPEKIYTFSDEELERMFKSGEMKLLTSPPLPKEQTGHEKALEKAKELFGKEFNNVFTLEIGGKSDNQLEGELIKTGIKMSWWSKTSLSGGSGFQTENPKKIELIMLRLSDLGFKSGTTWDFIHDQIFKLDLGFCSLEVICHQRLNKKQPQDVNWYYMPYKKEEGFEREGLYGIGGDRFGLWLDGPYNDNVTRWNPEACLVLPCFKDWRSLDFP